MRCRYCKTYNLAGEKCSYCKRWWYGKNVNRFKKEVQWKGLRQNFSYCTKRFERSIHGAGKSSRLQKPEQLHQSFAWTRQKIPWLISGDFVSNFVSNTLWTYGILCGNFSTKCECRSHIRHKKSPIYRQRFCWLLYIGDSRLAQWVGFEQTHINDILLIISCCV